MAATTAQKASPAGTAGGFAEDVRLTETLLQVGADDPPAQVAQAVLRVPHELVAGIEFPFRRDCQILVTGSAAGEALGGAGATRQVQQKVVEGDLAAGPLLLPQETRQLEIFLPDPRKVLRAEGVRLPGLRHYRFQGQAPCPQAGKIADVFSKIQVPAGIGAPHVMFLVAGQPK